MTETVLYFCLYPSKAFLKSGPSCSGNAATS